jgi:hypothetical protein
MATLACGKVLNTPWRSSLRHIRDVWLSHQAQEDVEDATDRPHPAVCGLSLGRGERSMILS